MSPSDWVYNNGVRMFFVHASGTIDSGWITNANIYLLPVINLRSDVTFSGGNGTQSNPYVVV